MRKLALIGLVSMLFVPVTSYAFTISASAGNGGSISPAGSVSVTSGTDQTFSIGALQGFAVAGVFVDGANVGTPNSFTFADVLADHSISVSAQSSGGEMPYCSGPMAPGWQVGIPGGGCGGKAVQVPSGTSGIINGIAYNCPEWFGFEGCMVQ